MQLPSTSHRAIASITPHFHPSPLSSLFRCCRPLHPRHVYSSSASRFSTFAWGNSDHGQLGLPDSLLQSEDDTFGRLCPTPVQIPTFKDTSLRSVSLSSSHTAFIRGSDGALFTCGYNAQGQLGLGSNVDQSPNTNNHIVPFPTIVPALPKDIVSVACGARHTVVATHDGLVFTFGCNQYGQLGLAHETEKKKQCHTPQLVRRLAEDGRRIVSVAAGDHFTVALSDTGRVFTWGASYYGALGHGNDDNNEDDEWTNPRKRGGVFTSVLKAIQSLNPSSANNFWYDENPRLVRHLSHNKNDVHIESIHTGRRHVIAIAKNGHRVFTWGHGRHFLLGTESESDVSCPVSSLSIPGKTIEKVAAGNSHALILTNDGQVYGIGENEAGCLGIGERPAFFPVATAPVHVPDVAPAVDVAAGWNVSVVARADGSVRAFGTGRAGALGIVENSGGAQRQRGEGMIRQRVDLWSPTDVAGVRAKRVFCGSGGCSVVTTVH